MAKRAGLALALLMSLGGCAGLQPHEIDPSSIRPLVEFVERETGYRLDPLPRIIVDRERMALSFAGTSSLFASVPTASFSSKNDRPVIYLDHTRYMPGSTEGNVSLVHELVHYGQYLAYRAAEGNGTVGELRNRKGWVCGASTEWEASEIDLRYARTVDHIYAQRLERRNTAGYSACDHRGWRPTVFGTN